MRNIVICDDEQHICQTLTTYLKRFQHEEEKLFHISCFSSGEELIQKIPLNTDILFLDIKMGKLSGLQAARILRNRNNNVCIIFTTTFEQYALEGYEVHAFSFLKKPVQYYRFKRHLTDALEIVSKNDDYYISLQKGMEIMRINVNDIYYFESFGHSISIASVSGTEELRISLTELEKKLKNHGFFRCHKSYLVNHRHIHRIYQEKLNIANNTNIPISRHRRIEFLNDFTSFMGDIL